MQAPPEPGNSVRWAGVTTAVKGLLAKAGASLEPADRIPEQQSGRLQARQASAQLQDIMSPRAGLHSAMSMPSPPGYVLPGDSCMIMTAARLHNVLALLLYLKQCIWEAPLASSLV